MIRLIVEIEIPEDPEDLVAELTLSESIRKRIELGKGLKVRRINF